jgi:hypothetical protein
LASGPNAGEFRDHSDAFGHQPQVVTFAHFLASIEPTLADNSTKHADELTSLMTLNFQRFENVSLMAA